MSLVRDERRFKNYWEAPPGNFGALAKRPMGWNLIDAFTRLEEREERLRDGEERTDAKMLRLLELNRRAL